MNRMNELRIRKGLNMKEAAAQLKMPYTTYVNYEKGSREPNSETLIHIARFYGVTVDYLIGRENDNIPIPPGFDPLPETVRLPLVGRIACGTPILSEENITDYLDVPAMWGADFTLQCEGSSMLPRLRDGDVVAIRKQPTVENGQIAAVRVDGEITLKHVYLSASQLTLVSENPEVPPMVYGSDTPDLAIVGLAVGFMRSLV